MKTATTERVGDIVVRHNTTRAGKSAVRMFPCGCHLINVTRCAGTMGFNYCHLHRAAPELLAALKKTAAVCAGDVMNKNGLIDALVSARAAIRLAEPKIGQEDGRG